LAELVCPTVTVPKLRELDDRVTAVVAVPVRPTVCGLPGALSTIVNEPAADPAAIGEKVTPTVQVAPAAILAPQVLLDTAKPALAAMLPKLRATL
jgi:hypothetical protein